MRVLQNQARLAAERGWPVSSGGSPDEDTSAGRDKELSAEAALKALANQIEGRSG